MIEYDPNKPNIFELNILQQWMHRYITHYAITQSLSMGGNNSKFNVTASHNDCLLSSWMADKHVQKLPSYIYERCRKTNELTCFYFWSFFSIVLPILHCSTNRFPYVHRPEFENMAAVNPCNSDVIKSTEESDAHLTSFKFQYEVLGLLIEYINWKQLFAAPYIHLQNLDLVRKNTKIYLLV
ncbi:hypothetical protein BDA99DRAFT_533618 [Phascolomyces articulosus]|uniref:Uncharacterized protein n=1 Tax=Phascolomyces articulosus TaxID=60185 RepID=A0AAD5K7C2_9FUNG|nr:hypothetical protein BDA99DRAFT_533618 [Phascolomyces articulosus]